MKLSFLALIILFTFLSAKQNVLAQDHLNSYEPPPLFGEPKLPPPKIKKPPVDVIDPISKETTLTTQTPEEKQFIVQPRLVKPAETKSNGMELPSSQKKLSPKTKPAIDFKEYEKPIPNMKPIIQKTPKDALFIEKRAEEKSEPLKFKNLKLKPDESETAKENKLVEEPIKLLKTQVPPPKSEGVVTGPKTMPSVKKKGVIAEEIFVNETPQINIIERAQSNYEDEPLAVISLDKIKDFQKDKKNLIIIFTPETVKLNEEMLDNDLLPLAKFLAGNSKSLEIKAYAASTKDRPNSDRRIALDRGLAVRELLVSNMIEPHRINLKSFGNKTTRQPADFVEINIIN